MDEDAQGIRVEIRRQLRGGKDGVHALDFREVVATADGAKGVAVGMVGGDAHGSDMWQPVVAKRGFKFANAAQ